jgi:hypothetical protein
MIWRLRLSLKSAALARQLEPNICAGTYAHQPEQRRAEVGHSQVPHNLCCENSAEHDRPGRHLKTVEADSVFVAEDVIQEAPRKRRTSGRVGHGPVRVARQER